MPHALIFLRCLVFCASLFSCLIEVDNDVCRCKGPSNVRCHYFKLFFPCLPVTTHCGNIKTLLWTLWEYALIASTLYKSFHFVGIYDHNPSFWMNVFIRVNGNLMSGWTLFTSCTSDVRITIVSFPSYMLFRNLHVNFNKVKKKEH